VWRTTAASYALREALAAGIREVVFVIAPGKAEVAEHFCVDEALVEQLAGRGRDHLLGPLRELWDQLTIRTAVQASPKGLGHAVLCAREIVGDRPFALLLPDEVLLSNPAATQALVDVTQRLEQPSLLLMPVDPAHTSRYGIAALDDADATHPRITALVEKPAPDQAPSNLALIGRYVLTPDIFTLLADQPPGHGGEIQLTDALARLAARRPLHAVRFDGVRHDVGQPEGLLLASVDLALRDTSRSADLAQKLHALIQPHVD